MRHAITIILLHDSHQKPCKQRGCPVRTCAEHAHAYARENTQTRSRNGNPRPRFARARCCCAGRVSDRSQPRRKPLALASLGLGVTKPPNRQTGCAIVRAAGARVRARTLRPRSVRTAPAALAGSSLCRSPIAHYCGAGVRPTRARSVPSAALRTLLRSGFARFLAALPSRVRVITGLKRSSRVWSRSRGRGPPARFGFGLSPPPARLSAGTRSSRPAAACARYARANSGAPRPRADPCRPFFASCLGSVSHSNRIRSRPNPLGRVRTRTLTPEPRARRIAHHSKTFKASAGKPADA